MAQNSLIMPCLECGRTFKATGTHPNQKGFCSVACSNVVRKRYIQEEKKPLEKVRREIRRKLKKEYYQTHKEHISEYHKKYAQEHRDQISKSHREYYQKHRKQILAKFKEKSSNWRALINKERGKLIQAIAEMIRDRGIVNYKQFLTEMQYNGLRRSVAEEYLEALKDLGWINCDSDDIVWTGKRDSIIEQTTEQRV